jgi:protein SFI1
MDQNATSYNTGWVAVEAMNSLRQLSWRLFEIRGREKWAIDLREKHTEKHVRNMLRYWAARAIASRRGQVKQGDHLNEDDEGAVDIDEEGDLLAEDENLPEIGDLTAFDNSAWNLGLNLDLDTNLFPEGGGGPFAADNIISSTPLPGYLRTPSKRNTARAKARERLVGLITSAPPTAPRFSVIPPATAPPRQQIFSAAPSFNGRGAITPFERKLRAQGYSGQGLRNRTPGSGLFGGGVGGGVLGKGKTPARSSVGFAGFEDIPEDSERSRND